MIYNNITNMPFALALSSLYARVTVCDEMGEIIESTCVDLDIEAIRRELEQLSKMEGVSRFTVSIECTDWEGWLPIALDKPISEAESWE